MARRIGRKRKKQEMISLIKKLFCNHKDWIKRDVIVAKPVEQAFSYGNSSEDFATKTLQGQTTIVYECPKCGKLFTISAYGVPEA